MTTETVATASVAIVPELDETALRGLADSIKATIAAELRRLADELAPEKDAPAPAPRFVEVVDNTGDHGIHDKELDLIADFMTGRTRHDKRFAHMRDSLARLNAGTLLPEDVTYDGAYGNTVTVYWAPPADLYPPYSEVHA